MSKFLIADFQTGLETDKEPFLLPQDAFPLLEDAYLFRGRIERKFGFNLFDGGQFNSRLRINIGNTDGAGAFAGTVPGAVPIPSPGRQQFSIGTEIFTSNQTGAGVQPLITTGAGAGTLNNTTGVIAIAGAAIATAVFYYPGLSVMGLMTRETPTVNFEETVAFDTQFSYHRVGTGWDILGGIPPAVGSALWTGSNSNFFYTVNYRSANAFNNNFYVVNGIAADNIKYMLEGAATWTNLRPQLDSGATRFLETGIIILAFKNRLICLNTIEDEAGSDRTYENRCRWSQNGDPTAAATAWLDDTPGRGGYIDAPTSEAITAAQFVQDRLIVFFEKSTWELVYTGNEILPFIWQYINTELGCESTFSEIAFDQFIIGVGERGIHMANPNSVQRIDLKILDKTGQINNSNNGPRRVYGIRDFSKELVMWAYPLFGTTQTYPNKVLVYNYRNNSFAEFNDSFTCYGYFQKTTGLTWATLPYSSWTEWDIPWNAGISQTAFPLIISGNQQGWTFLFEETTTNDSSLMVTNVVNATFTLTVPDHNLRNGQYIILNNMNGLTFTVDGNPIVLANYVFRVDNITTNTFTINVPFGSVLAIAGTYIGAGNIEVLNNFNIKTKDFQLFAESEKATFVQDFYIYTTRTSDGEYTLNLYVDDNNTESITPIIGDSTVRTRPEANKLFTNNQEKIWHKVLRSLNCISFQLEFTLSDLQMRTLAIQRSPFKLHALEINAEPAGRL